MKSLSSIGLLTAVILAASPASAQSSLETDRAAGVCASYFMLLKKPNAAIQALAMADNQDRALQFGMNELRQIQRLEDRGAWTKTMQDGYVFRAVRECRKIGMRPSDFAN